MRYCRDKGQHLKSRSGFQSTGSSPVSGFFRFLSKVGDGMMKMQIVKIAFGDGKNA